jgi:hypothetical protein
VRISIELSLIVNDESFAKFFDEQSDEIDSFHWKFDDFANLIVFLMF